MMLSRMKSKIRSLRHQAAKKVPHRYMLFKGSNEYFIRNGSWLLEESISTFYGKSNPIHHFSVGDLNNMNVERLPYDIGDSYNLYRGSWEGSVVLVKKASPRSVEDNTTFLREIMVATQLATHNNAHKLLGCCLETEFPILVYDGMVVATLRDYMYGLTKRVLEWNDRLRIAWEISHVTAYLHTAFPRPIIHRGLNPGNVFLDYDNSAKLSDFRFSISIPEGEEAVFTNVVGTMGYLAPEYLPTGIAAESTDVYSFGAILLAILTGKHRWVFATEGEDANKIDLITWVQNGYNDNNINKIVDPVISRKVTTTTVDTQLRAYLTLALRCISTNEDERPTMMEVSTKLKNLIVAHEIPDFIPDEVTEIS